MRFARSLALSAFALTLGLASTASAQTYKVDPVHSNVVFRILHLNAGPFYGLFSQPTGTFTLGENASFDISIPADSVNTANVKRDDHLRGPDFFNVKQYPNITFKSTSAKKTGDNTYEVVGDLSLHGVTKPITVTVTKVGEGKSPRGQELAGVEAIFTINRSEFGINFNPGGLGEEVKLMVGLEGQKQ